MMTFALFLSAGLGGYAWYQTGDAWMAFWAGASLGVGIGNIFISAYQGIIRELIK